MPGASDSEPRPRQLDRRAVLRIGAFGAGGLCVGQLAGLRTARAATKGKAKAAILFWMAGGPSHIDMVDMKPDAAAEVRGPFQPIATNLPGLLVNEFMPRHTNIADRLAVVRSISHNLAVHDDGSHWMQTGYPLLNARAQGQQYPCEGSIVSHLRGAHRPGMPAYVCIPEDYQTHMGFFQAASFLGKRYDALNSGSGSRDGKYSDPGFILPPEVTLDRLSNRRQLLKDVDRFRKQVDSSGVLRDADQTQQQAFELVGSQRARDAFNIDREPKVVHELYGRHAWGQAALLARRLVEAGVTFVTINLYEKDVDWWDDHYKIVPNLTKRLPRYDQAFSGLISDLNQRGLADDVLVAAYGEFGRAPRIDSNAGRGHWPKAMSVVLSGGGIRGGQIVGATTSDGGEPKDRPLVPGDLLATIYHTLGINPKQTIPDRLGRPTPLVPHGKAIRELV